MRVNSEKQTLILAGEPVPRRPLTLVATPLGSPMLLVQSGLQELGTELTAAPQSPALRLAARGSANNGANSYARTQQLTSGGARPAIIDTYA